MRSLCVSVDMTNAEVVKLVKAGTAVETIKSMFRQPHRFDVDTSSVIDLHASGVPDPLIKVMVELSDSNVDLSHACGPLPPVGG